jgi:acetylornithine aminotransferase/acetylornithine/N-succinyldiaminopimelate aminotransferase
VRPLEAEYLRAIRSLCDHHGLLLIFDEVQTGLGRTGTLFAHEQLGVTPDIMTLAKALGNGLPIGAMLTTEKIAASLVVGTHASTFGGNPVAAAAAVEVLKIMLADGFLASVQKKSRYFIGRLQEVAARYPQWATGVRGRGLLLGLLLTEKGVAQGMEIVEQMFAQGALINFAGNRVLRFVPPLIVSEAEIDALVAKLCQVFDQLA